MASDLILNVSDTGFDPVAAGALIKYRITASNSDVESVSNGAVVFDLPLGATLSKVNGLNSCTAAATTPVRVTCTLPELKTEEPLIFDLEVDTRAISGATTQDVKLFGAIGFADQLNTITGSVESLRPGQPAPPPFYGDDGNTNNNWQEERTTLERSTDLRLVKQGPATIIGGGIATYTVTVHNDGPSPTTGFTVADSLSGPTYVPGSFAGSDWSFNEGSMTATYTGAAIPEGGSATFTLRAKVNAATGTVENLAVVEPSDDLSQPRESNPENNNDTATTVVTAGADLAISKGLKSTPVIAGEQATFQIQINNPGPSPALNPSWEDTLPEGFTLTEPLPILPNWICAKFDNDTRIKCDYTGSLAVGAVVNFEFNALAPSTGTNSSGNVTNTAHVESETDDPNTSNNAGAITFPVMSNGVDLALTKKKNPKLISVWNGVGDDSESRMTSLINVLNDGPGAATSNVQVVDELSEGEEFVSGGNTGEWSCSVTPSPWTQGGPKQVVTCDLDPSKYPLPKDGRTPELKIITRARAPNLNMENQACTGGSGGSLIPGTSADNASVKYGDRDSTNNCAGDGTRTTLDRVDLALEKRTNAAGSADNVLKFNQNTMTYTLRVTNLDVGDAPVKATGIVVNDTIPGYVPPGEIEGTALPGTGVTASSVSGWACVVNAGSVTCRSNAEGLEPGESEDITITVTRPLFDSSAQTGTESCGVDAPATGAYCNTAGVAVDAAIASSIAETNAANNQAKDWVAIERQANMRTAKKSVSNNGVGQIGVNSEYKITYFNDGPSLIPDVVFRDVLTVPANDPGFVFVSASRTPSTVACTVETVAPGIVQNPNAGGGTSYSNPTGSDLQLSIACPALNMAYRQNEVMTVVIRPNRHPNAPAGRSFHDVGQFEITGGATGPNYNFNTDSGDDTKDAELTFTQEAATLVVNKDDLTVDGEPDFGGVDPLGFDGLNPGNNTLTYRVSVQNLGPSVASNVMLNDTLRVPVGQKVRFLGMATSASYNRPADAAYSVANCTVTGSTTFTGAGIGPGDAGLNISCNLAGSGFANNAEGVLNARAYSYAFLRYEYLDAPAANGDTVMNTVSVSAVEAQTVSKTQDTTVRTRVDLSIAKSVHTDVPVADPDAPTPAAATDVTLWQPFYWVMDATNHGPGASLSKDRNGTSPASGTGTVITDTLPAGTELIGDDVTWEKKGPAQVDTTPVGSGTCSVTGLKITCNVGDVTATGKVRVIAKVRHTSWPSGGKVKNVTEVKTEQVDSKPNNNKDEEEIPFVRSSLSGVVYEDRLRTSGQGGNRQADSDEPGIGQVVVRLSGTDSYGNALSSGASGATVNYIEVTTGADGRFNFDNLPPSDAAGYTVTQVQPSGYLDSPDMVPVAPAPGAASHGGTYNGSVIYSGVQIGRKDTATHYDFPEIGLPSLSGLVYVDVDRNNTYGAGDTLIDGAVVELLDASNPTTVLDTRTTVNGAYKFENLDPLKVYTLREPLPTGYANRPDAVNKGKIGGVLCATGCTPGNGVSPDEATTSRISDIDLSSGQDGTEFNFGENLVSIISGRVYLDQNDDGSDNTNEPGIAGVTITLEVETTPGTWTAVVTSQPIVTDANGHYSYDDGVVGNNYRITETQPTRLGDGKENGTVNTGTPNVITITNLPAAGSTNNNFGEIGATLSGVVFLDRDNDGIQDAGEPGLSGVEVELPAGTLNALGVAVAKAVTNANGEYTFVDLLAGTYTVTEQILQPSFGSDITSNGITKAGTTGGTATDVDTVPSAISGIVLAAGGVSESNNFGEILVARISGTVYVDRNDNGSFDGGDAGTVNSVPNGGIKDVTVVLYAADGITELNRAKTDEFGNYSFGDLLTGVDYVVKELQPAGYGDGKEHTTNEIRISALPVSGSVGNNFGETLGSLAGYVYEDFSGTAASNNNGMKDAGEKAIGGVTLNLTGTDAAGASVDRTVTSDVSTGEYSFGDLLAGTYVITEIQPSAYIDGKHTVGDATTAGSNAVANIISGIGLTAGQNASGYLFGELANAPISGTVYIDRNNDGKQDAGETGIPNVSIVIEVEQSPGTWVKVPGPAIVTDANGHYSYPDAVTGKNYRITETQPTDLGDGKENGTVNTGTPNVITISNLPATGSQDNNYGEIAAVLSGVVYLDSNNNGLQDTGEPGLPNVEVELPAGTLNALGVAVAKVMSGTDGKYQFIDLLAGTYTVTEQLKQPLYGGAETSNGKTTVGSTTGTATDVDTVPSAISGIILAAGGVSENNNFGEVLVAGISGTVYVDRNDNGSFDAGDAGTVNSAANGGIEKVTVVLYAADGTTELKRVETDAQGNYAFANLPTGVDYVIKELQPAGYAEGKEHTTNEISIKQLPLTGSAGNNFGEKLGALAGYVYEDFSATTSGNNNGVKDAGEKAIEGVTLTLSGTDKSGATIPSRTTTTNSDGEYSFGDLLEGTYTITETQPTGYEDGKHTAGNATTAGSNAAANTITGIGLSAGQLADGYLFGELKKAPISGTVYIDRNDNGDQDGSEPGIPGVTIVITSNGPDGKPGGGDDVNETITTDKDGNYSWPDAIAGVDYTITQTQPTGLADGKENTSNVITISNLPATGSQDNNFGEIAAVLSGVVYLDSNNNGKQDTGEPGLPNVEVELPAGTVNAQGVAVAKAVTDADGKYQFIDLLAGSYKVTQQADQPSWNGTATANGITTVGTTTGTATGVNTVPSAISGITLAAGGTSENNNFGEVLQVSIAGTVFLDVDNDGAIAGAGEIGLDGVVIELSGVDDTGATVTLSTTTDKDGKFSFEGLRPGKYSLTEPTQPTGTANGITTAGKVDGVASGTATPVTTVPSKIADIDLSTPGSASVDNLFGEIPRSSGISGKVWVDTDNDGVVDPDEKGISGVTVELEGTAIDGTKITVTVTTDADGNYSFTDLPPGTYTVTEPNQPPGTLDGKTVPGSTGGTASTPGTTPSKISTIKVGVNETSTDNNFGEIPVGSIAGFVYNDSNDDGIKQSDEGGYALIDVVLTGTDDLGNAINVPGKTDAQGHYVFENLRPGTYVVTEPTQPAETLNGLTTAGTVDGDKSNAKVTGKETTPSMIDGIVLRPGNNSVDNNFGEIGDSPDMLVSKSSTTVKFTVNNVATYTIRVRNGGQQASKGEYLVKDRLPVGLNLAEVPSGNGWTCSGAVGDTRFECRSSEVLSAGVTSTSDITVKVNVTAEAAKAGTVNNAVLVEGGGENEFRTPTPEEKTTFEGDVTDLPVCDTAITQNVCRVPNEVQLAASVGGTVWFDIGSEDTHLDGGDERLQSWIVELLDAATGLVSQTTTTAVDGSYRFGDVVPGIKWNLQFRDPASGVLWAWPVNQETAGGMGVACDGPRAITDSSVSACRVTENGSSQLQVVLEAGQHLPQQSLPVDPSGLVYDAVTRDPVPGSIVTLTPVGLCNGYDPLTAVLNAAAGGYKVEGNAVSMTVGNSGYYQFVFGPAAPARCEFQLTVTPPGGYQFVSSLITPQDGSLSPAGAAGSTHMVQPQASAPTGAVGTATQYWLNLFAGSATAGIVHNHIPLDTAEATGLVITKTGDRQTAEIGDTVQYTITVRQTAGSAMATLNIVDTLPRGFTYIDGTARVGGRALDEPFGKPGPRLGFNLGPINVGQQLVLTYRVRVGVGAQQGDGINRAQAHGCSITGGCIDPESMTPVPGSVPSNRAEYRVRVTGGVFTEEACVLGKVFVDCNNNHLQDNEELGIPGVRLYFSNGTWVISDSEGKYSYCGLTPQSHTLKVDASTLPAGSRLTTSSNRNLGDADSLFLDLKNGELHRADFIEGSCSNPLLEQVKARRTQGEVRAPETETGQSPLRFESKPARAPQQATDSANQRPIVHPRPNPPSAAASQEVQP